MSSNLSKNGSVRKKSCTALVLLAFLLTSCDLSQLNNPYTRAEGKLSVLYSSFSERPKHLDPAKSYSANEYVFISQIYEPPFQYHYLKRPYTLEPLSAAAMPEIVYFDADGSRLPDNAADADIAFTDYLITIKPGILYQPHPALAFDNSGRYLYHDMSLHETGRIETLVDFKRSGTRELTAEDFVYQIKRLASPKIQSPIAELMKHYIVGFDDFYRRAASVDIDKLNTLPMAGVTSTDRYRYSIRIKGKYPQFIYWLAMPFFAPVPWEADVFYSQQELKDLNITLDWFPVGTGPYLLQENNPNRRMILLKNPNFHGETYPTEGEPDDRQAGLLNDAGKPLPFIDKVVFTLEKESIPYWNKFLQGYYDASGIAADSFDQAIQFSGSGEAVLAPSMVEKGIKLQKAVATSIYYMGFNMLDATVGPGDRARKLRQAIAIAIDFDEFISIFMNGRGIAAQGMLPPGIFGYVEGEQGINPYVYDWKNGHPQRKPIDEARRLLVEAGYPGGVDPKTGQALILYFDTMSVSIDDRPRMNWFRKQFKKLGIKLVIRGTDYNRFQQKMLSGNAQIFMWGWNADYPDPENFFFLLFGPNGKVAHGGENAGNYQNPEFDRLFKQMRSMDNGEQRFRLIQTLQAIVRRDAPWVFGFYPEDFTLFHSWYKNLKPNMMANNRLKYTRIDTKDRAEKRRLWNKPVLWPVGLLLLLLAVSVIPAVWAYRRRMGKHLGSAALSSENRP
ncbi:MAG: ABC transporter substrate-binding protein [Gammaproteobacteria bacterium]